MAMGNGGLEVREPEGGQRNSMSRLEPMELNGHPRNGSVFTQDLTTGFEPKYRGQVDRNGNPEARMSVDSDPWAIKELQSTSVPWKSLTGSEKIKRVGISIAKAVAVVTLLYFFVCSLDCLSLGFRLVGGKTTGEIFKQSEILKNPVVGVMIGILTTVLVQSSSTSTSIIVSMVAADFLEVKMAIPIVMGANIGTSITNTIVSLTQAGDRNQFRRAFAGATVHDMFNWLTVIVLLIVEVTTGFLYELTTWIMDSLMPGESQEGGEIELLSVITDPFVDLIVKLNSDVMECYSDKYCETNNTLLLSCTFTDDTTPPRDPADCNFLFSKLGLNDAISGAILLVCSLAILCTCLVLIVKVLQSVMKGQMANVIRKTLNAKIPYVPWITGYLAIGVGALMTFLVQSSSVFTSALTPLVGLGVISVERVYPLTLGSNIGTTTTALLASMAVEGDKFKPSLQVALCHLFFNISGILIFYPIPFMRFPIAMSKFLGETTAKYRWFAIVYMILMFVCLPVIVMGLSFAGSIFVIIFAALLFLLFGTVILINFIRKKRPSWLPRILKDWKFLPAGLRSLEPYDRVFTSLRCCKKLQNKSQEPDTEEYDNAGFEGEGEWGSVNNGQVKTGNNLTMVHVDDHRPPSKNGSINPTFTEN